MNSYLPPGPGTFGQFGLLQQLRKNSLATLLHLTKTYGDIVYFTIGHKKFYVVNHPDYVKEIVVTQPQNFVKTRGMRMTKRFLGEGLLTSEGQAHKQHRRIIQPAFQHSMINKHIDTMVDAVQQKSITWENGGTIDCFDEMMQITFSIISSILFTQTSKKELQAVRRGMNAGRIIFSRALNPIGNILNILPLPSTLRLRKAQKDFDSVVFEIIQRNNSENSTAGDILSYLLSPDTQFSIQEIRDEILTLLLTGHETTALGLAWACYLLSQHPEVEHKLSIELDAVLNGRQPTFSDIPNLHYTKQVIQEVLRLYPPVYAFGREAIRESTLGNYTIPVGAVVYLSPYISHRDDRFYEKPDEFNPERWSSASASDRPKLAYFPFGAGNRGCIGESLAWLEMTVVIAELVRQWKFNCHNQQKSEVDPLITLRPRDEIIMEVIQKSVG